MSDGNCADVARVSARRSTSSIGFVRSIAVESASYVRVTYKLNPARLASVAVLGQDSEVMCVHCTHGSTPPPPPPRPDIYLRST